MYLLQEHGKTTILRDLIRKLSNGIEQIGFKGINIGVVDERGEIAAMYRGIPQNDIGIRTDVLDNVSKEIGLTMLIRSMAPKVVVADEIGNKEEIKPIMYAMCSGIKGIFTDSNIGFDILTFTCPFSKSFGFIIPASVFTEKLFLST